MSAESDLGHLRRCLDLASEALDFGAEPFGSALVDAHGVVRHEDRNRTAGGDQTRHPEFELARWSTKHMSFAERASATVYTSGEHCPMCAAAHGWVGLGPIVYAGSTEQLTRWQAELQVPAGPVAPLPINEIVPNMTVRGPFPEFAEELRELHRRSLLG